MRAHKKENVLLWERCREYLKRDSYEVSLVLEGNVWAKYLLNTKVDSSQASFPELPTILPVESYNMLFPFIPSLSLESGSSFLGL